MLHNASYRRKIYVLKGIRQVFKNLLYPQPSKGSQTNFTNREKY